MLTANWVHPIYMPGYNCSFDVMAINCSETARTFEFVAPHSQLIAFQFPMLGFYHCIYLTYLLSNFVIASMLVLYQTIEDFPDKRGQEDNIHEH